MAIQEGDDWPGNVRELEAVVKRAMVRRRRGWVTPEDIVLPKLRRDRFPNAVRALGTRLTPVQELALRLASGRGAVRRRDLVARGGISPELARRALLGLERAGLVRREGRGRGVLYLLAPPGGGLGPVADSRGARPDRGSSHAPYGP
jgi:DNA-binding NtrC family response regulator